MADELDIVVGVKVEADPAKIQSEITSKTKDNIKVEVKPTLSGDATSKLTAEINKLIKPQTIKVSIDAASISQARAQVKSIFDGAGNLNDIVSKMFNVSGFKQQAQQMGQALTSSTQAVADVMKDMNPSNYALRGTQDLINLMRQLGVEASRTSRVVAHLEGSGVFKPTSVSWKTGQQKYTTEEQVPAGKGKMKTKKSYHVTQREQLQSFTVNGLDENGQEVTRSFKWDQQVGQFVSATVGAMKQGEARVVSQAQNSTERIRAAVTFMQSTMKSLMSQAFNQGGNKLEGDNATKFQEEYDKVWNALSGNNVDVTAMKARVADVKTLLKELQSQQKAANELANKSVATKIENERVSVNGRYKTEADSVASRLKGIGGAGEAAKLEQVYNNLLTLYNQISQKGANANADDWERYNQALSVFNDTLAVSKTRYSDLKKEMDTGEKANALLGGFDAKNTQAENLKKSLNLQGLTAEANNVENALNKLKAAQESLANDKSEANIKKYNSALKEMNDALQTNKRVMTETERKEKQRQVGLAEITKIQQQWTKAMQDSNNVQRLNGIKEMFESDDVDKIRQATRELQIFKAEMRATGQAGLSAGDQIKKAFNFFAQAFGGTQALNYVRKLFTESVKNTAEVDKSMTLLQKVSTGTTAQYNQYLDNTKAKAQELATTLTGLIDSTTQFSKLGYSLNESADLAAISQMYANVGDIDSAETAANYLISTLNGFHLAADDAMAVIDKFDLINNKYAISAEGIGEGLARSAAALYTSNTSLEKSIALMTAANTVVQDEATVGNALKTLSARIRASKTELAELGEEQDEFASSTSKLRGKIMELTGVDIMVDNNTFKDLYEILGEISEVYDRLTDTSKANVQEILFGKLRSNVGAAILTNFDIAESAYESAMNADGTASREYDVYLKSVEAKRQRMEAAFQSASSSFIDKSLLTKAYDIATGLLNTLEGITKLLGSIPTLITAIVGALSATNNIGRMMPCFTDGYSSVNPYMLGN